MTTTVPVPARGGAAAVIGANGFIGSALCAALANLDIATTRFTREQPAVRDGRLSRGAAQASTLYLLAGRLNPALAEQSETTGVAELSEIEVLLRLLSGTPAPAGSARRVVVAGSGGTVYDSATQPPYREDAPVAPANAYGRLKLAAEVLLREFDGSLEPVVARFSNVYGPGQRLGTGQGVIGHWLAAAREGGPIVMYGDPATTRDYLYVGDAVDALVALHTAAAPVPGVLNVGSGEPTSLGELAELVRRTVGRPDLEVRVTPARGFDRHDTWLDVRLAHEALCWSARTTLPAGLRATWASMVAIDGT